MVEKLLMLDELEREQFNNLKMLSHDESLNEILVGLTVEESPEYIRCSRYSEGGDIPESFVRLHERNIVARKEKLINESYANYFRTFRS